MAVRESGQALSLTKVNPLTLFIKNKSNKFRVSKRLSPYECHALTLGFRGG